MLTQHSRKDKVVNMSSWGGLKEKRERPPLHRVYPDEFSFDELPAYYFQSILLLREAKENPKTLETAKEFMGHGQNLADILLSTKWTGYLNRISEGELRFKVVRGDEDLSVQVETFKHILQINFQKNIVRSDQELITLAQERIGSLLERTQLISHSLSEASQILQRGEAAEKALQLLSSKRSVISLQGDQRSSLIIKQ
jgi:hypothetical protein